MVEIMEIPLVEIDFSDEKIRPIDAATINDLRESIKKHGVLQPILVRKKDDGRYEVIFGHHRCVAAKGAELTTIPAQIKNMSKTDALILSISENIQRLEMEPIKEGELYAKIIGQFLPNKGNSNMLGSAIRGLAEEIGKHPAYIKGRIDLFEKLSPDLKPELGKKLTIGCAERLIRFPPKAQKTMFDEIEKNRAILETKYHPPTYTGGCGEYSESDKCSCPRCGSKHWKGSNTLGL